MKRIDSTTHYKDMLPVVDANGLQRSVERLFFENQLVKTSDAAKFLAICKKDFLGLVRSQAIPFVDAGDGPRGHRFRMGDLVRFIEQRKSA